ncbi:MAG: hypothetical protein ACE5D8_03575 [Fidelibacterota bacterium]
MRTHLFLFLPFLLLWGQEIPDQETLLENILSHYQKIEDYSVRVTMSVTMPKFRMPRKKIDIYYKNPGKIKIESDGFAIVPKAGITMSPDAFLSHLDAMDITEDPKGGVLIRGQTATDSLSGFIPGNNKTAESSRVTLILHVNREHWYIDRVSANLDSVTIFQIESEYEEVTDGIWMPIKTNMVIRMPSDMQSNIPDHAVEDMGLEDKPFEGNIIIRYSRYKINKGIKDSFFNEADAMF